MELLSSWLGNGAGECMKAPITNKQLLEMMWDRFPEIMKRGVEKLAQQEPESECNPQDLCAGCRCKYAEQPAQQEPVGSLSVRYHRNCKSMTNTDFDYNGDLPEGDYELYTSPAQRTWVGLTDEDIRQCSRDVVAGGLENSVDRFAYAIETKLRDKNT